MTACQPSDAWPARHSGRGLACLQSDQSSINPSPARLNYPRDFSRKRQLPEANTAELELSDETSWSTAALAAAVITHAKFFLFRFFCNGRSSRHYYSLKISEFGFRENSNSVFF